MEARGIIRKITIGDLKEGITYKVGQAMLGGQITIKSIIQDPDYLNKTGVNRYDILVSQQNAGVARLWKTFENMPVSIEYDINEETYV